MTNGLTAEGTASYGVAYTNSTNVDVDQGCIGFRPASANTFKFVFAKDPDQTNFITITTVENEHLPYHISKIHSDTVVDGLILYRIP